VDKEIESENNSKKAFDEQTLAKVLEAAYVLQEHNRELRERELRPGKVIATAASASGRVKTVSVEPVAPLPTVKAPARPKRGSKPTVQLDYTVVLGQIVETQQKIQADHLEMEYAMLLIAERAAEIAEADGAGVGLLINGKIRYCAAAGAMALPIETEVAMEKALSSACLRIGQVVRCSDVNTEFLVDVEECRRRGIQSMIAAPIHHSGNVVGALELYYAASDAFAEPDVHTCQLMAGLVAESLVRAEERGSAKTSGADRDAMQVSSEKLNSILRGNSKTATDVPEPAEGEKAEPVATVCRKCGSDLVPEEQFCGECGWPCGSDYLGGITPSPTSSLWKPKETEPAVPANGAGRSSPSFATEQDAVDFLRKELPEFFAHLESVTKDLNEPEQLSSIEAAGTKLEPHKTKPDPPKAIDDRPDQEPEPEAQVLDADSFENADAAPSTAADWSSAASAREFLENFPRTNNRSTLGRFLKARRGDIYLAVAVILISIVIRWGIWSSGPANSAGTPATATAHKKPGADLPLYDRVLISLGLAEAPAPPEYKGNPDTQVWVDVQTALYYCPGADLYGKTPKGRLTTQRDAQLDQFEPATRKACD